MSESRLLPIEIGFSTGASLITAGVTTFDKSITLGSVLLLIGGLLMATPFLGSVRLWLRNDRTASGGGNKSEKPNPPRTRPGWQTVAVSAMSIAFGAFLGTMVTEVIWPRWQAEAAACRPAANPIGPHELVVDDPPDDASPMFRGDPKRTGVAGGDAPADVKRLTEVDRFETYGPIYSSPAVVDGIAYIGIDRRTVAWDTKNDHLIWERKMEGAVNSSPAVADGVVYIGSDDGFVYALNADTGEQVWKAHGRGMVNSSPIVAGNVLFVGSGSSTAEADGERSGHVVALDLKTGNERWCFSAGEPIRSSPALDDDVVYVGSWGFKVHAIDARTGHERWMAKTNMNIVAAPAIADSRLFIGNYDGYVFGFKTAEDVPVEERKEWTSDIGAGDNKGVYASPAVADGHIFVARFDGVLYKLTTEGGDEIWRRSLSKWEGELPARVYASPTVAGGVVYVGSSNGFLYAVDARSGDPVWCMDLGSEIRSTPVVADGRVYVATLDGIIHVLGTDDSDGGETTESEAA